MSDSRTVRDNPDLARLVDEGYAVRIAGGHLVIEDVPFVAADKSIQRGSFLCPLDRGRNGAPGTHVMWFHGGVPHDQRGVPLAGLNAGVQAIAPVHDLASSCAFSLKPPAGYTDFYDKVSFYAATVVGPAQSIAPEVSPCTFKPVITDEGDGVFKYLDTFSSRARITAFNQRLALGKVVIVGAGGTGSYLLDLLAKTPIQELHIYDGDTFGTHNAFRSPGAAGVEDLSAGMTKVDYLVGIYSRMRRQLHAHPVRVTADNVAELLDADFVFLAMDPSPDKEVVVRALVDHAVPFIDTGIGVGIGDHGIGGLLRVTTAYPGSYGHIDRSGVTSQASDNDADYNTNVQVSELNMMTAAMAVIQFKQHLGFYADDEHELHMLYSIDGNDLDDRFGRSDATPLGHPAAVDVA